MAPVKLGHTPPLPMGLQVTRHPSLYQVAINGNKVEIMLPGNQRVLSLAEVEVFAPWKLKVHIIL